MFTYIYDWIKNLVFYLILMVDIKVNLKLTYHMKKGDNNLKKVLSPRIRPFYSKIIEQSL